MLFVPFVPFFLSEFSSRVTVIFLQRLLLARAASPSIYRTLARNYRSFERRSPLRIRSRLASSVSKGEACGEGRVKLNETTCASRVERGGLCRHCGFRSRHRFEKMLARLLNWIWPYEGNTMTIRAKDAAGKFLNEEKEERREIERARAL